MAAIFAHIPPIGPGIFFVNGFTLKLVLFQIVSRFFAFSPASLQAFGQTPALI
jgi:hypothetical protein